MRSRRRNSDEAFRRLHRKVAEGDTGEIPALARAYQRQGGSPLSDAVLRDVAAAFENMERVADSLDGPADILLLLTDMDDYPECDENGAANADAGYIKGVSDVTGLTYNELWALSEKARKDAGAQRRARLEAEGRGDEGSCDRCGVRTNLRTVMDDDEEVSVCASCWETMGSPPRVPPAPNCSSCNARLDVEVDYGDETGQWEDQCRRCRVGPECSLCSTEMGEDEAEGVPTNQLVCADCREPPAFTGRCNWCPDPRNPAPRFHPDGSAEHRPPSGPTCTCAHVQSFHVRNGTGRCLGVGADLDAEYGIPPEEPCACTVFDASD